MNEAFVDSFVQSVRRERVRLALANPKKRRKFVDEFAHITELTFLLPSA